MKRNDKILLTLAIIAAICLFLLGRCNGIKSVTKQTITDTVVTVLKGDTVYVPEFVGVTNTIKEIKYITNYDTLWPAPEVFVKIDTVKVLGDYFLTRTYSDTQTIPRGKIIITDEITKNRIASRRLQSFITDSFITKTVVLKPPRKMVGYFTMSAMGNLKNPGYGVGIGFGLKMPKDMIYQVEYKAVQGERPMVEGRVMLPIRLNPFR
jgi:hypothetical protein